MLRVVEASLARPASSLLDDGRLIEAVKKAASIVSERCASHKSKHCDLEKRALLSCRAPTLQ